VRLAVTAHLELHHLTILFKLRQNIFIEFPEIKNCPGLNCTTNYSKFIVNNGVMFLKIAMQGDKTQKTATATSQSLQHFPKCFGIYCFTTAVYSSSKSAHSVSPS
jgi:hypothetical protein